MSLVETRTDDAAVMTSVTGRLLGNASAAGRARDLSGPGVHQFNIGRYRLAWVGRPRILGSRNSSPQSVAEWLADRWPVAGPSCLAELGGAWGLCIEDNNTGRICLAVDRFGGMSLFYELSGSQLRFSSTLDALIDRPRDVNPLGVLQYIVVRHVAGEDQLIDGVKRVLPGHFVHVTFGNSGVQSEAAAYFHPALAKSDEIPVTEAEAIGRISDAMREELADGWPAEESGRPIGLLFSSGLDSAYVLGSMTAEQRQQLKLVTFGFKDNPSDDIGAAREALRHFPDRLDWEPFLLNEADALASLDKVILQTQLPVDHPNFLARSGAYQNLANRGANAVIAGEGSDTLLGGVWYVSMQKMLWARRSAARLHVPHSALRFLAGRLPSKRSRIDLVLEKDWQKVCLLAKAYLPIPWLEEALKAWGGLKVSHFPYHKSILDRHGEQNQIQGVYEQGLMANMSVELMAEQGMAAAAGTFQWNPFLDGRFPDAVCPIPADLRTKSWKKKYLLYLAANGKVPANVLQRPKCGCPAPLVRWFSSEHALGGALDSVTASNSFCGRHVNRALLRTTVDRFRSQPNSQDAEVLWVLLNLERWNALVLDVRTRTNA